MAENRDSKTEGYLFFGNKHKESTLSFGLASKNKNRIEGKYSYTPAGVEIKRTFGNNNAGIEGTVKAELGKVEVGYSYDKSTFIPEITGKAEANLAKMSAEAKHLSGGIRNELMKAEAGGLGIGAKVEGGGRKIPVAIANTSSFKSKLSAGYGDAQIELSPGKGEGSKHGLELSNIDNPLKAEKSSSYGNYTLGVPGLFEHDFKTGETKGDFGSDTLNLGDAYKSLRGRGGEVIGNVREVYSEKNNRDSLLKDSVKVHIKNDKTLKRTEGKEGLFSGRKNRNIADTSAGYISQIDNALGYLNREKDKIDQKSARSDLSLSEYDVLAKQSDSYKKEIDQLTEAKKNLSGDFYRAYKNTIPENSLKQRPTTNEIIADAYKNAENFENGFKANGLGEHLADSATGICSSNNSLSNKISELDSKISDNNKDIARYENIKNGVLESGKYKNLRDAIEHGVPGVDKLNDKEAKLRAENNRYRFERGECQKALLEIHKNFNPNEESAQFEKNGRDLKGKEIDNNNAILAKKDEISNYCNSQGISKDKNGEYSNKQDKGLNNLLSEKNELEKKSDIIKENIKKNDKDLRDSELKGKSSLRVDTNGSNAEIKSSYDDYADRHSLNANDDNVVKSQDSSNENKHSDMTAKTNVSDKKNKQSEMPAKTSDPEKDNRKSEMPAKTSAPEKDNRKPEMPAKTSDQEKDNRKSEMPAKTQDSEKDNIKSEMPAKSQIPEKGNKQSEMPSKSDCSKKENFASEMPNTANGSTGSGYSEGLNKAQNTGMVI